MTIRHALLAWAILAPPARAEGPDPASDRLRAIVEAEHRTGRFDGVALVAKGDRLLGEFAFGEANRSFRAPHRVDEPFPIASITKQVVAVLAMQRVEAGRIGLDDPIASRLPAVADRPWAARVTVRHLLAHTSGLPQPDSVVSDYYSRPDLAADGAALARLLAAGVPEAEPGARFAYNNADYALLGAMIEAVDGAPLGESIRRSIAGPLGLGSTGLIRGREIIPGLPDDYDLDGDGPKVAPHAELANFGGAGAGYSTLRDLWAFDRALMAGTLLNPASTARLLESTPERGYAAFGCWTYPLAIPGGPRLRIVERHGQSGGYHAVNLYAPEAGWVVILACNISSFEDPQTWGRKGLPYRLLVEAATGGDQAATGAAEPSRPRNER